VFCTALFEDLAVTSDDRSQRYDSVHEMAEKPVSKGFLGFLWAYWISVVSAAGFYLAIRNLYMMAGKARTGCKGKRGSDTPKA
jgi:hypothetical protein